MTPGISALAPSGIAATAPNTAQTYTLKGQTLVPAAGTIQTVIGGFRITLLTFLMTGLPSKTLDVVQNFDSVPGFGLDTLGRSKYWWSPCPHPAPGHPLVWPFSLG